MRRVTRNFVGSILVVLVLLLGLGALPSYVQTGDPYHVEATVADGDGDGPAIDLDALSEERFPFTFEAVSATGTKSDERTDSPSGRSTAYYTGPVGVKERFTHTPFDEFDEFQTRQSGALDRSPTSPVGDVAYVTADGVRYRLEIVRVSTEGSNA
ncbi:MAG: hypothetical protein ACLFNI_09855 [Natronomonas sp.]